jgi:DNA-binding CsgD family transcriptional regulator
MPQAVAQLRTSIPAESVSPIELSKFAAQLDACTTSLDIRRLLRKILRSMGIANFRLLRFQRGRLVDMPWNEGPDDVVGEMRNGRLSAADPVALRACRDPLPFFWTMLSGKVGATRAELDWIASAVGAGCNSGMTIPVHGPSDTCDVFHCSRRSSAQWSDPEPALMAVAAVAFIAAKCLRKLDKNFPVSVSKDSPLSLREIEVLTWCKEGKSYAEIASILGISAKTVEFHITNSLRKLGVNQKISAILTAVRQGWLDL